MAKIRNAREVDQIYQNLGKKGKANDTYVLECESGDQLLIFFGARHSNDPADTQWPDLENLWQKFVSHKNDKKVVLYEQGPLEIGSLSKKEALRQESESGLIVWLAAKAGISSKWPEPDRISEVLYLKNQGYSDTDIMGYYFARQMLQWVTRDFRTVKDWKTYAEKCITSYGSLGCWDEELSIDKVIGWFKHMAGKDFDIKDSETMYRLSDPSQSKVSAASGQYRDEELLKYITEQWLSGFDIFAVYGSGHAIALEPVIEELVKGED